MVLLERDGLLAQLRAQWEAANAGPGRLAFVEGEAGIGKSTLLRRFVQTLASDTPVLWGACEALLAPRALAPLEEMAVGASAELRALLDGGTDRHRLFVAFVDWLAAQPRLIVIEDLHWADGATLDLLRYAGRRMARTRSLLLASFRNDELVPAHPLRTVLGDLSTGGAIRLAPQPLSLGAVRSLCGERELDAAELHRLTAGNPFFVTEVLAAGEASVPVSVQDAVLARAARLSASARAVLDAAAVAGPRVEPWLLQELAAAENPAIDECLATGVLVVDESLFSFRHELARQAVLRSMTPTRAMSLHRLSLQALASHPAPGPDAARLARHADGASDSEAVRLWAPVAAQEASGRGAHRQAADCWALALKHTPQQGERAPLLEAYATEVQMAGGLEEAIAARHEAAQRWRERGQDDRAAAALARLASVLVLAGRNAEGEAALRNASALVGPAQATPAALRLRICAAAVRALDRDCDEAIALVTPALAAAEHSGDGVAQVECLQILGIANLGGGRVDEGLRQLEQCLALAEVHRQDRAICQALTNLGSGCGEAIRLAEAEAYLRRGIAFGAERDLDAARLYATAWLALVCLARGQWDEAARAAHEVLHERRATPVARIMALIALGRLRARRGDPGIWTALDEARELAAGTATLQRVVPMLSARAEALWLEGRAEEAALEVLPAVPAAIAKRQAGFTAELLFWRRRAGGDDAIPPFCSQHPFALEAAGAWREAAQAWRARGCPFDAARALSAGDESAQREALTLFEALGARPMVEQARLRLRAAGVRGLALGPRASTREHPAGLTAKEVAVLSMLVAGLRNKDIAKRLSRSPRTIDHHLQSIFAKLGVATRTEAVSTAYRMGITPERAG